MQHSLPARLHTLEDSGGSRGPCQRKPARLGLVASLHVSAWQHEGLC